MSEQQTRNRSPWVEDLLPDVGDVPFRIGVAVLGLAMFALLANLKFCPSVSLPKKPPAPVTSLADAKAVTKSFDNNSKVYESYLKRDSLKYGLEPTVGLKVMSKAIPYQDSVVPVKLDPKGKKETVLNGLQLSLTIDKIKGTHLQQMVLRIENLNDKPVAYRIETRPSKGTVPCHQKEDLVHNAVAIAPGAVEERSECIWRKDWGLEIKRVETMELNELSYIYVSQLPPASLPVDLRVVRAHRPVGQEHPCKLTLSARIKRSITSGDTTWRDMVDFFARHRCETYGFPNGYTAWEKDAEEPLPASSAN